MTTESPARTCTSELVGLLSQKASGGSYKGISVNAEGAASRDRAVSPERFESSTHVHSLLPERAPAKAARVASPSIVRSATNARRTPFRWRLQ